MDRGAWWATVHGVAKSRTLLSDFTFTFKNLEVWETIPAALGGFMAVSDASQWPFAHLQSPWTSPQVPVEGSRTLEPTGNKFYNGS